MLHGRKNGRNSSEVVASKPSMMICRRTNCSIALLLLLCWTQTFCYARDTLTYDTPIRDDDVQSETLVSAGGKFELGFFTPSSVEISGLNSSRYVGIWYTKMSPRTVVWVANREDAVVVDSTSSTIGVFAIKDGNLQVLDNFTEKSYWSTGLESPKSLDLTVMLMDSGNLVLLSDDNTLWQSFQNPGDTFIPGMVMDKNMELTSWRGIDDPGIGNFTFKLDQEGDNQFIISRKSIPYWKSGEPGKFSTSAEMPPVIAYILSNFTATSTRSKSRSNFKIPRRSDYNYTRLLMNSSGELLYYTWLEHTKQWNLWWWEPRDPCDRFKACGNFGTCNSNNGPLVCKCLPGFKPQRVEKWDDGDFSSGCVRESTICKKEDTFLSLYRMKVGKPDSNSIVANETECRKECLSICKCQAYSYDAVATSSRRDYSTSSLCWTWLTDLNNLQEEYGDDGHNLTVRIPLSDSEGNLQQAQNQPNEEKSIRKRRSSFILIVVAVVTSVVFLACIVSVYFWRSKITKRRDKINRTQLDSERRVQELMHTGEFKEEEDIDVPFFDLRSILDATDNFSPANKLGQGGYGPVYKGKFLGDQEIAVKRLSRASGQGLQEFKNEVVLIAKLQHRNLVRLKGYCMKGEEKILLYEYMPNRSLDSFIFDDTRSMLLDWEMRFNIILGIARGLLYLHQDSRLRIIHRDMKTSNILLDEEMNPKISDFGLARIVGGKETGSNTNTVVGTYGYMSPEYALDGTFSVKSDVFSFGVVLLEIISGKKNTGFYQSKQTFSLINYAWGLWTDNKVLDLMDKNLGESCNKNQISKCVKVGLLCVQEDPVDRPTMSNVITLLDGDIATSPSPKQPAFLVRRGNSSTCTASSSSKPETFCEITTSTSLVEGR